MYTTLLVPKSNTTTSSCIVDTTPGALETLVTPLTAYVNVIPSQLSLNIGSVCSVDNQVQVLGSVQTTTSLLGQLTDGTSLSITVTSKLHKEVLLQSSTASKVKVVVPSGNGFPDGMPSIRATSTSVSQLSIAID